MKDREIRERRAKLGELREQVNQEWKAYDARYPVEVGAHKPPDYDRQQLQFVERLRQAGAELSQLPSTKAQKLAYLSVAVALLGLVAWLLL